MYQYGLSFCAALSFGAGDEEVKPSSEAPPVPVFINVPLGRNKSSPLTSKLNDPVKGKTVRIEAWDDKPSSLKLFDRKLGKNEISSRNKSSSSNKKVDKKQEWNDDLTMTPGLFGAPPPIRKPKQQAAQKKKRANFPVKSNVKQKPRKQIVGKKNSQTDDTTQTEVDTALIQVFSPEASSQTAKLKNTSVRTQFVPNMTDLKPSQIETKQQDVLFPQEYLDQIKKYIEATLDSKLIGNQSKLNTNKFRQNSDLNKLVSFEESILEKWRHLDTRNRYNIKPLVLERPVVSKKQRIITKAEEMQEERIESILKNRRRFFQHRSLTEASLSGTGMSQWQIISSLSDIMTETLIQETSMDILDACDDIAENLLETC